ncbi:hypothetical protein BU24DRAFT_197059 [Aaosphaeria arxii CBS 175.79]|uniref:Uncharacterized protein n=1 Tax=Aaosphaeria arxii CBS 175.79 TaxID=1450172 RepID=A0A6A5XSF0_9PLEO|nr:uncharacterized protein BU24DRAFT_197059 [Aaosphaeria arxii CBS 175.79]KAF2016228.1 hypothetical protein BU24DRAFT_197059 [Aaosphaeria arxii CBS 175.79]
MVRIPRRTHSVSGPPTVHCMWKDVACCCNMVKIHQFHSSMMALRRNPERKCREWSLNSRIESINSIASSPSRQRTADHRFSYAPIPPRIGDRQSSQRVPTQPFRFFDLPREVRDHVYSYLVIRRGKSVPILEAKSILRGQKKRVTSQRTRERLNLKRIQSGRRPLAPREPASEPVVHLNLLQTSRLLHFEASDYLYQNWFAISLDNFPITTIDTPYGWNLGRISKMQLELQLKDVERMNSYVDWSTFFANFPSLRLLRIIPTFHPRYYDWARTELRTWHDAHFVFRAFFRELMASIPPNIHLKLGPSLDPEDDMQLEGRAPIPQIVLQQMCCDIGVRVPSGRGIEERHLAVGRVIDVHGQGHP